MENANLQYTNFRKTLTGESDGAKALARYQSSRKAITKKTYTDEHSKWLKGKSKQQIIMGENRL